MTTTTALDAIGSRVAEVADDVGPAVVGLGRSWASASGVVIAPGQILTNAHALGRGEPAVSFADGHAAPSKLLAADPDADVAVLDVDTGEVPPVRWACDAVEALRIGTPVIALADPGGGGLRATPGFVSSTGRWFRGPRGRRIHGSIEHTAALPRGSSGGPLVALDGGLLGLNSRRSEGGLILALPADSSLRSRVATLAAGTVPARPRLGITVADARIARRLRRAVGLSERDGLLVRVVGDGSPAQTAGVERGDLLVAAGERELSTVDELFAAVDAAPGATLVLGILRGETERELTVSLESQEGRT